MIAEANWWIVETTYWGAHILFALFVIGIVLSISRIVVTAILAFIQKRNSTPPPPMTSEPLVSIIVPAYNEEVNAVKTIHSLLQCNHRNIEIIFVDDGSADSTLRLVQDAFSDDRRVLAITKPNGGKASALNHGIASANGELLVCIDADTNLDKTAVGLLVRHFSNPGVAAVAGNVKVGNEISILTKWQSIEYITSQNFDRRAFDRLNCITVVPGAIGAFRKDAVLAVGGLTTDTLAEDCDLTIRLLRAGHTIRYEEEAIAWTEVPETLKMFLKQRFRWSFGIMQNLWKHRDVLLNREYGALGLVAFPNILVFQFILPFASPLADLFMLVSIATGNGLQVLAYYLVFLVVDFAGAAIAFGFEREEAGRLWLLIPQRFGYRQIMYFVLFKSVAAAFRGRLVGWGVLKRTGSVQA
jgi:poly-beta-1,6 N-acetyl-D-glucosamine synthase